MGWLQNCSFRCSCFCSKTSILPQIVIIADFFRISPSRCNAITKDRFTAWPKTWFARRDGRMETCIVKRVIKLPTMAYHLPESAIFNSRLRQSPTAPEYMFRSNKIKSIGRSRAANVLGLWYFTLPRSSGLLIIPATFPGEFAMRSQNQAAYTNSTYSILKSIGFRICWLFSISMRFMMRIINRVP